MKPRWMYFILVLALIFIFSACGDRLETQTDVLIDNSGNGSSTDILQPEKDNISKHTKQESTDHQTADPQNRDVKGTTSNTKVDVSSPSKTGSVHSTDFSGKISGCYYAVDNMVILAADKLYLYDTQKGESIASVDISLQELSVQTYPDGYFVVGQEIGGESHSSVMASQSEGSINGYLLNQDFIIEKKISFQELLRDDIVLGTAAFAIAPDGKNIAFGGLNGLYLYDILTQEVSTILNYSENGIANDMQILMIESFTFIDDMVLAYTGIGTGSSDNGNGVSIYGTVSIDSAKLTITRKADYEIGEVQKGGDLLVMPQSLNKQNGTLLMFDTDSYTEKTMTFSRKSEGKDGIFCSGQGTYVATSTLGDTSVTINIYDTASGTLLHTETVEDSNHTYFLRIPQILILDESHTCIVVLGRGISEVNTLITTFGFKE